MSVSLVNPQVVSPNFKSNRMPQLVNVQRTSDGEYRTYEVKASTGKKWGAGLASFVCPGLGQATNNQWGKALGFWLGMGVPALFTIPAGISLVKGKSPKTGIGMLAAAGLASLGIKIWSIVDAVKNSGTKVTQYVPNTSDGMSRIISVDA